MPMSWMKTLFLFSLMMTMFFGLTSNSWFMIWIFMEMNMMCFIPICFNSQNQNLNAMLKYFIIQSLASSILLLSIMIMSPLNMNLFMIISSLSLFLKLGLMPFHSWFINTSENLNWKSFTILSTIQKFIPLHLSLFINHILTPYIIILSAFMAPIMMMFNTSLMKIFSYSSISHLSWMMVLVMNNNTLWMFYLLIYSFIMLTLLTFFKKNEYKNLIQTNYNLSNSEKKFLLISVLSLSGLPPLLGFLPKWMTMIQSLNLNYFILFILIFSSLLSMFMYLKLFFPTLMMKTTTVKKYNQNSNILSNMMMWLNMIMLIPLSSFLM